MCIFYWLILGWKPITPGGFSVAPDSGLVTCSLTVTRESDEGTLRGAGLASTALVKEPHRQNTLGRSGWLIGPHGEGGN
jgi:hypothetical protein